MVKRALQNLSNMRQCHLLSGCVQDGPLALQEVEILAAGIGACPPGMFCVTPSHDMSINAFISLDNHSC